MAFFFCCKVYLYDCFLLLFRLVCFMGLSRLLYFSLLYLCLKISRDLAEYNAFFYLNLRQGKNSMMVSVTRRDEQKKEEAEAVKVGGEKRWIDIEWK